jgi:uncharacterized protein YkwD
MIKQIILFFSALIMTYSGYSAVSDLYDVMPDITACTEGKLKSTETQKVLDYVNKIRAIHKLPAVTYNAGNDVASQKTSLIMAANDMLTHKPESSLSCYSDLGKAGALSSNLYISYSYGINTVESSESSVSSWMIDGDVLDCGHRRWIINPWIIQISYGRVDGKSKKNAGFNVEASNLYYTTNSTADRSSLANDYVAYPYENYPKELIYDEQNKLWLFSFTVLQDKKNMWGNQSVNFSNATIQIVDESNVPLSVTGKKPEMNGYGVPNCLLWNVPAVEMNKRYNVTISGVVTSAGTKTYNYWFKMTDGFQSGSDLSTPVLSAPTDKKTSVDLPVTLSWNTVSTAKTYELRISEEPLPSTNNVVYEKALTSTSYLADSPNLLQNKKYYWSVRAYDANGKMSSWSQEFTFTTKAISTPTIPLASQPEDGAVNVDRNAKFIWRKSVSTLTLKDEESPQAGISYNLQVSTAYDFSKDELINKTISDTFYVALSGVLPANTIIYWRVRAANGTLFSNWSPDRNFKTGLTSDIENEINNISNGEFYNYPNPFEGKTNIIFNSSINQQASIEIFDLLGNKVATVYNGILSVGSNLFSVELNSGIYYCRITSGNDSKTIKIVAGK